MEEAAENERPATRNTNQLRRFGEGSFFDGESDDDGDNSSEVSTEIDSIHDDEQFCQNKRSIAIRQSHQETAPGDDQLILDLEELTYLLKLEEDKLNELKKIPKRVPVLEKIQEGEIENLSRVKEYLETIHQLQEKDDILILYRRSAAEAYLDYQRVTQANETDRQVMQFYKKAFFCFEEAIKSREEQCRCGTADSTDYFDHCITRSFYSLGLIDMRAAQAQKNQETAAIESCEKAREHFQQNQIYSIKLAECQNHVNDPRNGESLEERLKRFRPIIEFYRNLISNAQKLGDETLQNLIRSHSHF